MVYLDHNATTPLRPEVWEAMGQARFGHSMASNPSSVHKAGLSARRLLSEARETIASELGAQPGEIVFTGGGSEAINLALKGVALAPGNEETHMVATTIEHHAVLHALQWLGARGVDIDFVGVDRHCRADPEAFRQAIRPNTALVSVMYVNNETGAIQPVEQIGAICRERGVLLHIDAVQAVGKLPVNVNDIPCDLLSCSAHKIGGPKGVGALYVREGTPLEPLVHGGPQESARRAGTENVMGIVGFAKALQLAGQEREDTWERWVGLRECLYRLPREMDAVRVNSHPDMTVPNCVNMAFIYCDGMALAMNLSVQGVYVSTGSACTSGDLQPSHVLRAMGLSDRAAHGALRFSMGPATTQDELETAIRAVRKTAERLRVITMPDDIGHCEDDCPCFVTD